MKTVNCKIKMKNHRGLHMRLAAELSRVAHSFDSKITFLKNGRCAELSSIFALLALSVVSGDVLEVSAKGDDAYAAVEAISNYIANYKDAPLSAA